MKFDWLSRLTSLSQRLNNIVWAGSAVFLVFMLFLVLVQIFARYLLQDAPPWTEEGARYAMIWSGLLGAVVSFQQYTDPVLVQVNDQSSIWIRRCQAWFRAVCVLIFAGVIIYFSCGFLERAALRYTEALNWNLSIIVSIIPLFAVLLFIQAILKLAVFELTHMERNASEGDAG